MLTTPATPSPVTLGITAGERVGPHHSPMARGLCRPGPTPAPSNWQDFLVRGVSCTPPTGPAELRMFPSGNAWLGRRPSVGLLGQQEARLRVLKRLTLALSSIPAPQTAETLGSLAPHFQVPRARAEEQPGGALPGSGPQQELAEGAREASPSPPAPRGPPAPPRTWGCLGIAESGEDGREGTLPAYLPGPRPRPGMAQRDETGDPEGLLQGSVPRPSFPEQVSVNSWCLRPASAHPSTALETQEASAIIEALAAPGSNQLPLEEVALRRRMRMYRLPARGWMGLAPAPTLSPAGQATPPLLLPHP